MDAKVKHDHWKYTQFSKQDLINISEGFGPSGFPMLPRGNMLMIDRVTNISEIGGKYGNGYITAELTITPRKWFFDCHFKGDPIMPGSLGVDGLCQILGFYLGWRGYQGKGRALSAGKIKYLAEVNPTSELIAYTIDIKKIKTKTSLSVAIADGEISTTNGRVTLANNITVAIIAVPLRNKNGLVSLWF